MLTPRQLAPTVGLAAALAGFHPDGTFYIDSGTRHLPARGRPRAPLPRVLFSSLPRLWSCKLRAIASLRQDASVSPATSASSPSTSVRAHARSTRNTAEVLPLDRLSLLRVAARAGMALMRRPAALPCGRAQLVPPRLLPGWLASSRRPARSPSLVGPVSPILHPDQLHPDSGNPSLATWQFGFLSCAHWYVSDQSTPALQCKYLPCWFLYRPCG